MKNTSFPECFPHWVFLFKNNKKPTNQKNPRSKSLMKNGNFIPCWWHNHFSSPGSGRLHKEMILLGIREDKTSVKTQKRQQGSGGGRDACELNRVETAGSTAQPHHAKGTWVSTQHVNSQLRHSQRCAARLAAGDSLCISAPNTLPSQPSNGRDQIH